MQSAVLLFKLPGKRKVKESSKEQHHRPEHRCETPVQSRKRTLAPTASSRGQRRRALLMREMLHF